jgi:glutamine synthetase
MIVKLEYIWLDGNTPEPNLRSKTKVIDIDNDSKVMNPENLPVWSYDGSSTNQAEGSSSDCLLRPVRVVKDPQRRNGYLVMCEVLNPDETPHKTNTRHLINDSSGELPLTYEKVDDLWFGFEQEYTLMDNSNRPLGFPERGYPEPQGPYYCAVGTRNVEGREIAEQHLDVCLSAGLNLTGINAEVMLGQWEYQLLGKGARKGADDLWLSRYLLHRICEQHEVHVEFHPKPVKGDWNGSGLHTNFSNHRMREEGGKGYILDICNKLKERHEEFIENYGSANELRLTGKHETQSIDKFSVGESDRGASIRIPVGLVNDDWKGYLEDRRPASNADPYKITKLLSEVLVDVEETVEA